MLELLFAEAADAAPLLVLPQLPGGGVEMVVRTLFDGVTPSRRRMLPDPAPQASAAILRGWYRDLWRRLAESERHSILCASGPGAACLGAFADRPTEVIAVVREPIEALVKLASAGARLPKERTLHALGGQTSIRQEIRAMSNPQARALLAASTEQDELPVTIGPPPDADRWRRLLFMETPVARFIPNEALPDLAAELADRLRCSPGQQACAVASAEDFVHRPGRARRRDAERLRELNWLDVELYEHCRAASSAGADR